MKTFICLLLAAVITNIATAQPSEIDSNKYPDPVTFTAEQDHDNMMQQLGIKALRPGPSGNEQAPNHANYDESLANPFPRLPDLLTLKNGRRVTTAAMWRQQRRPEIVEDFEREVLGRVPAHAPAIEWTVTQTMDAEIAGHPVVGKRVIGHADNSAFPAITVDVPLILVTPADVKGPVPVMIMFRPGGLPGEPVPQRGFGPPPGLNDDPPATEQLIGAGWGYAFLNPTMVQADN